MAPIPPACASMREAPTGVPAQAQFVRRGLRESRPDRGPGAMRFRSGIFFRGEIIEADALKVWRAPARLMSEEVHLQVPCTASA